MNDIRIPGFCDIKNSLQDVRDYIKIIKLLTLK